MADPSAIAVAHAQEVASCCSDVYAHPAARWLLGPSFHPGGLKLTSRLAAAAGIKSSMRVLDVGSGQGATAVHLAQTLGCNVVGLTLEAAGLAAGGDLAAQHGVRELVSYVQGDVYDADLAGASYDVVVMECVLSILPDKPQALERVAAAVRPSGRVAVSDVVVNKPIPSEYQGVLAVAGCVGDARSLDEYEALLQGAGLVVDRAEELREVAAGTVRDVKGKLMLAEIGSKLGKLPLDRSLIDRAKQLISGVQGLIDDGTLGYGMLIAHKAR